MNPVHRLKFVDQWPSGKFGEAPFNAKSYTRDDDLRILHIASPDDPPVILDTFENEQTRVLYRVFDASEVLLIGIFLGKGHIGKGLGASVLKYFFENIEQQEGKFIGTGKIRKPVVALTLSRLGLRAASDDFCAEVLPLSKYESSRVPKIKIIHNRLPEYEIVSVGPGGPFYEVISPPEVAARYPAGTPDRIIALHTNFTMQ